MTDAPGPDVFAPFVARAYARVIDLDLNDDAIFNALRAALEHRIEEEAVAVLGEADLDERERLVEPSNPGTPEARLARMVELGVDEDTARELMADHEPTHLEIMVGEIIRSVLDEMVARIRAGGALGDGA
jgi:hypothetical protein